MVRELPRSGRPGFKGLLLVLLALAHLGLGVWLNKRPVNARKPPAAGIAVLRLDLERRPDRSLQAQPAPLILPRLPLPVVVPIEPPRIEISNFNPLTQPPSSPQPAAAEAARPAPLNLAFPATPARPASASEPWRNPALSDPRANTGRADYATRMADTLGTDQSLRQEDLGPGRHRFRQGTTCVETAESRIAQIDPMGATMRGAPQLVTTCKK